MRYIQIGIFICLMAITGLLFAIYQKQQTPVAQPDDQMVRQTAPQALPPASLVEPEPEEKPAPARSQPVMIPARASAAVLPPPVVDPIPERPALAEAAQTGEIVVPAPPVVEESFERLPPEPAVEVMRAVDRMPEVVAEPEPRTATIAVGTTLAVRLESTLSTLRNRMGDEFRAVLVEPVVADGLIIADTGAVVEGRVAEVIRSGRVEGRAMMEVELTRLRTDDGQWVDLTTSTFREEAKSTKNRDLKRIGIGAAVGAAVGGIFGGGKGAAIGAGVGGGAGAGTAAATRGDPVVLRPETRIDFQLERDVTVTEQL